MAEIRTRRRAGLVDELGEIARELWADRRRFGLVFAALAWGTLGLTVLLGFGHGFSAAMGDVLARSGERMLRLSGGATTVAFDGLPAGRFVTLTPEDAVALRAVDGIARTSVEHMASARVRVGTTTRNARLHGVDSEYARIRGMTVEPGGRFFTPPDEFERRRVAVLGRRLATVLFGSADPVGRTLLVGAQPFVVVGVLERRITVMTYNGQDDDKVFAPAATVRALFGLRNPGIVLAELVDPTQSPAVAAAVQRVLARRERFDPADAGALELRDHAADARRIHAIVGGTELFLAIVGVLGLLVAAVGVGNSVHAMVEERTREIGLRLALGATPGQIRARQLVETTLLVVGGGGVGFGFATAVLAGLAALPLDATARAYLGSPVPSVMVGAVVAGLLGLATWIAGWQPARRAATIQPVEALRHD